MSTVASDRSRRSRATGARRRAIARGGWLTIPATLLLLAVFGFPLYRLFLESVDWASGSPTIESYWAFFESSTYRRVFFRTISTAFGITILCGVLGYPYAYLMTIASGRMQALLLLGILIPFWTSVMVRTFAWLVLLADQGPVNALFSAFGLGPFSLVRNLTGVVVGMVHIMLPFMVLSMYATMRGIDRRLMQAAGILGASPAVAFWRVYFPQSLPGVYAGSVIVMVLSLGFYVTPAVLGSPQQALLSQIIVSRTMQVLDLQLAGTMAIVLLVSALLILAIFSRLTRDKAVTSVGLD